MFYDESVALIDLTPCRFDFLHQRFPFTASDVAIASGLDSQQLPRRAPTQKLNRLAGEFQHPVELCQVVWLAGGIPKVLANPEVLFIQRNQLLNGLLELVWRRQAGQIRSIASKLSLVVERNTRVGLIERRDFCVR